MNSYSTKVSDIFQNKLKQQLAQNGYTISFTENALWRATASGVSVTCYKTLKLLVQGKSTDAFISKYLNIENKQNNTNIASENIVHDFDMWIGTDESGKGDYIGPLVTAGVMVKKEQKQFLTDLNIKDSKKLTDKFILEVASKIKHNCVFSVVVINPEKYNELYSKFKNLNKMLAWAHSRAIENILAKCPECKNVISDKFGDESLIKNALFKNGKNVNLIQRTKAESDIAVACASVLAREEFVLRTKKLKELYNIDFAKGGGDLPTKQASEFVKKYGKDKLNLIAKTHFKNTEKVL